MTTIKTHAALIASAWVLFAFSAHGEALTFTLDDALSGQTFDWSAQSSYKNALRAPAADDTVVIPANMTALLDSSDTTSWALVSSLQRVTPSDGATFSMSVASGSATLGCQVSWEPSAADPAHGKLVKTGGKRRRGAVSVTASGILYCDAGLMFIVR